VSSFAITTESIRTARADAIRREEMTDSGTDTGVVVPFSYRHDAATSTVRVAKRALERPQSYSP
jgi:hypothetical protein